MNTKFTEASFFTTESDEMIWWAFKDGDKEALAALYYRYIKVLIECGNRISHDKDLVKDCIHDLFIEIWNSKENLSVPRSVKAYLLICVQRKIVRYNSRKRMAQVEVYKLPDTQLVDSKEDELILDQHSKDQQDALRLAMGSLTRRQREAIHLKFYANLSYTEIVAIMNISADAIYNLISKAIDILQKEVPGQRNIGLRN
jgi:RNA polymerase sigma factor (sigma-70 family)